MSFKPFPPDNIRNMGTYLVASKGSGKSRFLGKGLVATDLQRGIPQLVIDLAGGTIDNVLDSLWRLPEKERAEAFSRIVYIDMGNKDAVVPFPIYYALSENDSPSTVARRFLDAIDVLDPSLRSASIEGWNALSPCGAHVGKALWIMGGQITEAEWLLKHAHEYERYLKRLGGKYVDCWDDVTWLLDLANDKDIERTTGSFLNAISKFHQELPVQAMFGASVPGIDWDEVIAKGQTVLVDFRHVHDAETKRFLMFWVLSYFLAFVDTRGTGRHIPIGLVIDEVSILSNQDKLNGKEPFAAVLDQLLNIWARQGQIWVTIAHQEVWQVSEKLLKTMMGCGTRIIGRTSDFDSAMMLANLLIRHNPHRIKSGEPMFDAQGQLANMRWHTYSLNEQEYQAAMSFRDLGKFQFLVKMLDGEGGADLKLRELDTSNIEPGAFPNDERNKLLRAQLHKRTAIPVQQILNQNQARFQYWDRCRKEADAAATMNNKDSHKYDKGGFKIN